MAQNFPSSPSLGQVFGSWQWDGTKWVSLPDSASGGGIPEAPADSVAYGRRNIAWTPVLMISGDILDGGNF
jgi:hypothetical protein